MGKLLKPIVSPETQNPLQGTIFQDYEPPESVLPEGTEINLLGEPTGPYGGAFQGAGISAPGEQERIVTAIKKGHIPEEELTPEVLDLINEQSKFLGGRKLDQFRQGVADTVLLGYGSEDTYTSDEPSSLGEKIPRITGQVAGFALSQIPISKAVGATLGGLGIARIAPGTANIISLNIKNVGVTNPWLVRGIVGALDLGARGAIENLEEDESRIKNTAVMAGLGFGFGMAEQTLAWAWSGLAGGTVAKTQVKESAATLKKYGYSTPETIAQLKSLKRDVSVKYHPDKGGSNKIMGELNNALDNIGISKSRSAFVTYKDKLIKFFKDLKPKAKGQQQEIKGIIASIKNSNTVKDLSKLSEKMGPYFGESRMTTLKPVVEESIAGESRAIFKTGELKGPAGVQPNIFADILKNSRMVKLTEGDLPSNITSGKFEAEEQQREDIRRETVVNELSQFTNEDIKLFDKIRKYKDSTYAEGDIETMRKNPTWQAQIESAVERYNEATGQDLVDTEAFEEILNLPSLEDQKVAVRKAKFAKKVEPAKEVEVKPKKLKLKPVNKKELFKNVFDDTKRPDVKKIENDMTNEMLKFINGDNINLEWIPEGLRDKKFMDMLLNRLIEEKAPVGMKQKRLFNVMLDEATTRIKGKPKIEEAGVDLEEAYEAQKDLWIGEKDVRIEKAKVEQRLLQKELKGVLDSKKYGDDIKDIDRAIQIYLDTKRNPDNISKYFDKLTDEQKRIVTLSQNLPEQAVKVANKIDASYKDIGMEALDADVIHNVLDNYAGRIWDIDSKAGLESMRKFGTKTGHAKQRALDTIIEGWANGLELKVEGATNNLAILKSEIVKTIEDKKFIEELKKVKDINGDPLVTTKRLDGYVEIEHPNFNVWKWAGRAEAGKSYGRNFFITNEGDLMEKQHLYAPKDQAKNLNNILGVSKIKDIPGVQTLTKYNAIIKSWVLQSSFFHHVAFMRSYYLGVNGKAWKDMGIRDAYKAGMQMIENFEPMLELGVRNGLTLGLSQDWDEVLLAEKTALGELLDKWEVSKKYKDKILDLRERQAKFLFGEFGAGLKAKSFDIKMRSLLKEYPNEDINKLAKMAARLINDDFGGLHLQRMGRNPTVQHVFRLFALAPDWTESNIRSMVKALKIGGGAEEKMYRNFWAGILAKGTGLTILANLFMAAFDEDDEKANGIIERFFRNYKEAWNNGNLNWTGVDITPIYKLFGGKTKNRKYFSVFGHFLDPIKFVFHPLRSLQHKGSMIYSIFYEALAGVDWSGRKFTTVQELFGLKGTKSDKGKYAGQTVKFGSSSSLEWEQIPSYLLSQIKGAQPVQVQNLIAWFAGEMEGFDAVGNSLGLGVKTTYKKESKTKSKTKIRKPTRR